MYFNTTKSRKRTEMELEEAGFRMEWSSVIGCLK
jgi:hypothetical protein